jgi:hypothetical protein
VYLTLFNIWTALFDEGLMVLNNIKTITINQPNHLESAKYFRIFAFRKTVLADSSLSMNY